MKPHEETWDIVIQGDGGFSVFKVGGENEDDIGFFHGYTPESSARAKLAAQAPAMARLLLKATVKPGGDEWGCLGCGTWEEGEHTEDCKLLAILRDAGVTE